MSENAVCLDLNKRQKNKKYSRILSKRSTRVKDKNIINTIIKIMVGVLIVLAIMAMSTITAFAQSETVLGFDLSPVKLEVRSEPVKKLTDNHYVLETDFTEVDFTLDDLRGTPHLAYNTSVYSGKYIENSSFTESYNYSKQYIQGMPAHIYSFQRSELVHAPNLKKNFLYVEIEVERQILLSLHVSSDNEIDTRYWLDRLVYDSSEEELESRAEFASDTEYDIELENDSNNRTDEQADESINVENGGIYSESYIVFENDDSEFNHEKNTSLL